MGDFNFPGINWSTLECDIAGSKFRDLVLDCYLHQHVDTPTRESNILDLVLSSDINLIEKVEITEHLGNSDHNGIRWKLVSNIPTTKYEKSYRQYHKADYLNMKLWLSKVDWFQEMQGLGVEDKWNYFINTVMQAIDKFVPKDCHKF